MYVITHALAPVLLAAIADTIGLERTGLRSLRGAHFLAIGLAGAAPDLLSPHLSLEARFSSWSHTLWFLVLAVPVAVLVARRFFRSDAKAMALWMITGVLLHLTCDAIAGGIAWSYPLSPDVLGDYFVHWNWWLEIDIFHVVIVSLLVLWLRRRERLLLDRPYVEL